MDVVIPGHSVRTFASSIQCLSKIGKDLYIDFDPLDGLALRALNDAKSAFCVVELSPSFFERCTTPTTTTTTTSTATSGRKRSHASSTTSSSSSSQDQRFSCRVPMRALAPIVRPRKGSVMTLRVTSEGRHSSSVTDNGGSSSLQLAFEFHLELLNNTNNQHQQSDHNQPNNGRKNARPTLCKVVHKISVAVVDNIAAVAPKEGCSELVAAPKTLSKWLEPIKRTAEACLIFTKDADTVVASSFNTSSCNLASAAAKNSILKTETSINLEDLYDYEFQDQRILNDDDDNADPNGMPRNVNEEVVLVFGMKEAKALLQFCCQNATASNNHHYSFMDNYDDNNNDNNHRDHDRAPWSVSLSFHWAGRPMIWESKSDNQGVTIQLVLATLSHSILKDLPMMKQRERSQQQQQQSGRRRSA